MTADQPLTWDDHQAWEADWWGDCTRTCFSEECKQLSYLDRMGVVNVGVVDGAWPTYDLGGRSVLDIGGGPTSPLLRCVNRSALSVVVDPCHYPLWTATRYGAAGISVVRRPAETYRTGGQPGDHPFDEAWLMNVLQHVRDPRQVIETARREAKTVRIFDWIDTPPAPGHPHSLNPDDLADWLRGDHPDTRWTTETFTGENGLFGRAFYGVFPQDPKPPRRSVPGATGAAW